MQITVTKNETRIEHQDAHAGSPAMFGLPERPERPARDDNFSSKETWTVEIDPDSFHEIAQFIAEAVTGVAPHLPALVEKVGEHLRKSADDTDNRADDEPEPA